MASKRSKRPTRIEIREQQISDAELRLGEMEDHDLLSHSTLEHCTLILMDPNRVKFFSSEFRNCIFRPKKKVQTSWSGCAWYDCVFYGKYVSTHFGGLSVVADSNPWGKYLVKGCDFSKATMHFCIFKNTDINSVAFPSWPCFTMLDPKRNFEKWKTTIYSIKNDLMSVWFENRGEEDARVLHWPTLAKDYEIDADPEEVKQKLQSLDNILL